MKRVMVIGGPGGGKSTFAIELATRTGLPLYHSDCLIPPFGNENEFRELVQRYDEIQSCQTWILDGVYHQLFKRAASADTIIFIDMPWFLRFWRVLKRWLTGDMAGHTHPLAGRITARILFELIFRTQQERRRFLRVTNRLGHRANVSILRSDNEKSAYLAALQNTVLPQVTASGNTGQTFNASTIHPNLAEN